MSSSTLNEAILEAYRIAKPHLIEELPGGMAVVLLVRFTLDDLRQLEKQHGKPDAR